MPRRIPPNITYAMERTPEREARLLEVLRRRQPGLTVVLENIHDPHNVSAILRSADSVGVQEVQLLYYIEEFPNLTRHGKRSSAGTRKWLPRHQHPGVAECYADLRARGFKVFASSLAVGSRSLYDLDLTGPTALLLGNENRGVSPEAAEQADATFTIPMMGMAQSLNVSVAAAVSLYEALRQRQKAGLYDTAGLGEEEMERIMEEWRQM